MPPGRYELVMSFEPKIECGQFVEKKTKTLASHIIIFIISIADS